MENKKYDLEKAKEDCRRHEDALEEAQSCMCGHCHECGFDPSEMKAALDEVERLRSQLEESQIKYGVDIASTDLHWQDEIAAKDARIKVLSDLNESLMENGNNIRTRCQKADADNRMLAMWNKKYMDHIERLEAAFLKAEKANLMHHMDADYADENAREELERIKGGGKDEQL